MGHSGYIDWHAILKKPGAHISAGQSCVYAFWLVDYERCETDQGITLFKGENRHPDWFLHADHADKVLTARLRPDSLVDTRGLLKVFNGTTTSRALLASAVLGTANQVHHDGADPSFWQCTGEDLTWRGKRLVNQMSELYLRTPILVTFLDLATDEHSDPETATGSATAGGGPGTTR